MPARPVPPALRRRRFWESCRSSNSKRYAKRAWRAVSRLEWDLGSSARELPKTIGRYEVARQLGSGAMGRVLLARDPILERHVAIKILRDDLAIGADVREALVVRMRHEARAAARVTHPHLVVIHDMGEDESAGLYLVFEYIEGQTLKQRLVEGRLSARHAARIARDIGGALTFAHERGVLHRDVKPENIILSPTGTKLTDFGIARVPDSTLTHTGGLLGTPAYSAPETFREGKFSPASDQFSLAATLYEAIRGERAFPGDDAVSVASKITNDNPERFAARLRYPAELDAILERGLSKSPAGRFEDCKALGNALVDVLLSSAESRVASVPPAAASGRARRIPPAPLSIPGALGHDGEAIPASVRSSEAPSDPFAMDRASISVPPDRPSPALPPTPASSSTRIVLLGLGALVAAGIVARVVLREPAPMVTASTSQLTSIEPEIVESAEPSATAIASVAKSAKPKRVAEPQITRPRASDTETSSPPSSSVSSTASVPSSSVSSASSASPTPSASAVSH
ncbi:MAG: protein kinase [Polyangiaceae bacterium]